jgi:hypothetical protein
MREELIPPGAICVTRETNGVAEILPLADQWTYKEWVGCFCYIGGGK